MGNGWWHVSNKIYVTTETKGHSNELQILIQTILNMNLNYVWSKRRD